MVNLVTLEWGKGAGKDHICRVGSLRIAYLLLCLPDPQDYYEMPAQDTIHLLNVACSAPQASQGVFRPDAPGGHPAGNWFEHQGVEVVEVRDPRERTAGPAAGMCGRCRTRSGSPTVVEAMSGPQRR